jgi:hypothetical protein
MRVNKKPSSGQPFFIHLYYLGSKILCTNITYLGETPGGVINVNKLFARLELIYPCLSERDWNRVTVWWPALLLRGPKVSESNPGSVKPRSFLYCLMSFFAGKASFSPDNATLQRFWFSASDNSMQIWRFGTGFSVLVSLNHLHLSFRRLLVLTPVVFQFVTLLTTGWA